VKVRSSLVMFMLGTVVAVAIIGGVAWWTQSAAEPVTTDAIGDKV